jgi:hypothetical protein
MTVKRPPQPPLPEELDRLLRRLRLPYVRRAAPEVIATANAQRWEHAEVLRVLLAEEAQGRRDRATISMRRRAPACRPARPSVGREGIGNPEADPARAAHPGMGRPRRSARRVRPIRYRQEPPHRSARPPRDRPRQDCRLAHARDPRAAAAATVRRWPLTIKTVMASAHKQTFAHRLHWPCRVRRTYGREVGDPPAQLSPLRPSSRRRSRVQRGVLWLVVARARARAFPAPDRCCGPAAPRVPGGAPAGAGGGSAVAGGSVASCGSCSCWSWWWGACCCGGR